MEPIEQEAPEARAAPEAPHAAQEAPHAAQEAQRAAQDTAPEAPEPKRRVAFTLVRLRLLSTGHKPTASPACAGRAAALL